MDQTDKLTIQLRAVVKALRGLGLTEQEVRRLAELALNEVRGLEEAS